MHDASTRIDPSLMRATIVGSGDAFSSGGRAHTCIRIDCGDKTLVVDFGASAMTAWKRTCWSTDAIDAILVSHLHGDHFGGVPFLLLECQFSAGRTRPLTLVGPPGFRARLEQTQEALYPDSTSIAWHFPVTVMELDCGRSVEVTGFRIDTHRVQHPSGAPATAIRVRCGGRTVAYSGDCAWTDTLIDLADGADLFIVECTSGDVPVAGHIDWPTLRSKLPQLKAKRKVVTHLAGSALARAAEMECAGLEIAHDGLVIML